MGLSWANFGFGLGLTPPKPAPKVEGATTEAVYRPTGNERTELRLDQVTHSTIQTALSRASQGAMRELADIYDIMLTNPILGGIVEQRQSGSRRLILGALSPQGAKLTSGSVLLVKVRPANDTPRAAAIAEEIAEALDDQDAPLGDLIESGLRHKYGFGGATEVLWKFAGGRWAWCEFVTVPGQRIRFDADTGEMALASSVYGYTGTPLSVFEPGTWATWLPDSGILNFGTRGILRRLVTDWFHVAPVGGQWAQTVERFGSPVVDVATDSTQDREAAKDAGDALGSQAVFIHSKADTEISLKSGWTSGIKGSPHADFEESRKQRAAIAILGAEQTVAVTNGSGSQASAAIHAGVREDKLFDDLDFFLGSFRSDILTAYVLRNYGPDAVDDTAVFDVDIQEPVNRLELLAEMAAEEERGLEVTVAEAYRRLGRTEPAPGEETLRQRRARLAAEMTPDNVTNISAGRRQ